MTEGTDERAETVLADDAGQATADTSGQAVVIAFGQTMKTLRVRAGLEREAFGRRIGYSASTVAWYEQGRRIPSPRTIEAADEVLDAGGLPTVWKEQVERAFYHAYRWHHRANWSRHKEKCKTAGPNQAVFGGHGVSSSRRTSSCRRALSPRGLRMARFARTTVPRRRTQHQAPLDRHRSTITRDADWSAHDGEGSGSYGQPLPQRCQKKRLYSTTNTPLTSSCCSPLGASRAG